MSSATLLRMIHIARFPLLTIVCAISWMLAGGAAAVEFPDKPPQSDYFVDAANMLDADAKQKINSTASALLSDEQIPLFVVTIPSLASFEAVNLTIESYAQQLFDHWGIGSQERNYGMLLLVSRGGEPSNELTNQLITID